MTFFCKPMVSFGGLQLLRMCSVMDDLNEFLPPQNGLSVGHLSVPNEHGTQLVEALLATYPAFQKGMEMAVVVNMVYSFWAALSCFMMRDFLRAA